MRDYYLTFVNDDIDKMRIFGALLDAGLKDFVITETEQLTYENWKRTVAENEQVECNTCQHEYCGQCDLKLGFVKNCEKYTPKMKKIDIVEE